jgi:hypothetical protein
LETAAKGSVLSLCDRTGNMVRPWATLRAVIQDAGPLGAASEQTKELNFKITIDAQAC